MNFRSTGVFETGLSDFHKMVVTVTELHFPKQKQKIIKNFVKRYLRLNLIMDC